MLLLVLNIVLTYVVGVVVGAVHGANAAGLTWVLGGLWVFVFTFVSTLMCHHGRPDAGILIAFLAWPMAGLAQHYLQVGQVAVSNFVSDHESLAPEYALACKSAGAKYLDKPSTPVRSIAYDWEGKAPPELNMFKLAASGRIESIGFRKASLPASIEFIEARCCVNRGLPSSGEGPYIREPNVSNLEYFGVKEITADALVKYDTANINTPTAKSDLERVSLTVSDRRDGRTLATFTYVSDTKNKRMCGETSVGIMDEAAFVRKAVGLD